MEKSSPQISLYVTKHYGSEDIAGYFSVTWLLYHTPTDSIQLRSQRDARTVQDVKAQDHPGEEGIRTRISQPGAGEIEARAEPLLESHSWGSITCPQYIAQTLKNVSKVQEIKFTLLKLSRYLSETSFNVKSKPLVITNNLKCTHGHKYE